MATSSITKQYVLKDKDAYQRLLADIEKKPLRQNAEAEPSCLEKGKQALASFSFR